MIVAQLGYTYGMADPLERLRNPKPGSAIAAARDFGIDLTLVIERLRRTPQERLDDLQQVMTDIEEMRRAFQPSHDAA